MIAQAREKCSVLEQFGNGAVNRPGCWDQFGIPVGVDRLGAPEIGIIGFEHKGPWSIDAADDADRVPGFRSDGVEKQIGLPSVCGADCLDKHSRQWICIIL